jgi:hypothetical protein
VEYANQKVAAEIVFLRRVFTKLENGEAGEFRKDAGGCDDRVAGCGIIDSLGRTAVRVSGVALCLGRQRCSIPPIVRGEARRYGGGHGLGFGVIRKIVRVTLERTTFAFELFSKMDASCHLYELVL